MTSALRISTEVWPHTIGQLQRCGQGQRECVVYWVGPLGAPERVDLVVHPVHSARPWHYQVDDRWLTSFWFGLAQDQRSVRAQVHTHGGVAGHSTTDDDWPLVHTPGFLSLVLPAFAMGQFDPSRIFVARLERGGTWTRRPLQEVVTADGRG